MQEFLSIMLDPLDKDLLFRFGNLSVQVEPSGQRFRLAEQTVMVKVEDGKVAEIRVSLLYQRATSLAASSLARISVKTCQSLTNVTWSHPRLHACSTFRGRGLARLHFTGHWVGRSRPRPNVSSGGHCIWD